MSDSRRKFFWNQSGWPQLSSIETKPQTDYSAVKYNEIQRDNRQFSIRLSNRILNMPFKVNWQMIVLTTLMSKIMQHVLGSGWGVITYTERADTLYCIYCSHKGPTITYTRDNKRTDACGLPVHQMTSIEWCGPWNNIDLLHNICVIVRQLFSFTSGYLLTTVLLPWLVAGCCGCEVCFCGSGYIR